jgi:hypothetical protein
MKNEIPISIYLLDPDNSFLYFRQCGKLPSSFTPDQFWEFYGRSEGTGISDYVYWQPES